MAYYGTITIQRQRKPGTYTVHTPPCESRADAWRDTEYLVEQLKQLGKHPLSYSVDDDDRE